MKNWSVKPIQRVATLHFIDAATTDTMKKLATLKTIREKNASKYTGQSSHGNDHMMKSLRREWDEVKNAMKGKTAMNLNGMLKQTDSPFTTSVLECPLPQKFHLSQLEFYDSMKDPLDHIRAFKTIPNLQQTPDEVICKSFPATLKGAARVWFSKLPASSIANFKQLSDSFVRHFIGGNATKGQPLTCWQCSSMKGKAWGSMWSASTKLCSKLTK